jgi:hypothetical protein
MPLIDLKTDFKSLKFGNDRPQGGSSNQPYIQTPIPDDDKQGIPSTKDFLLRGGLSAPINAAKDVSRLTQMFFDSKDPSGLLFTAKENLLSRTSVKTEASTTAGAIYTPLSTLGQSATGFAGGHLNLLGLDPTGLSSLGIQKYEDVIKSKNESSTFAEKTVQKIVKVTNPSYKLFKDGNPSLEGSTPLINPFSPVIDKKISITVPNDQSDFDNRLVNLYTEKQISKSDNIILEYGGGPGSILGIGKTRINFSSQRTGINNPLYVKDTKFFNFGGFKLSQPLNFTNLLGASDFEGISYDDNGINGDDGTILPTKTFGRIEDNRTLSKDNRGKTLSGYNGYQSGIKNSSRPTEKIKNEYTYKPDKNLIIDKRVNTGNPGSPTLPSDPTRFKYNIAVADESLSEYKNALDKITAGNIYSGRNPNHSNKNDRNDLVKFSIGVLRNDSTGKSDYMHFRSFIDSFDDSYTSNWGDVKYAGRGDKFFNYQGFDRSINMSFTVYAQSKAELIPMYKKLNFLASSLAPSYGTGGFMQGNLVYLTLGGYLYKQLGIIQSLTYTVPQESTWEIGISRKSDESDEFYRNIKSDNSVKELPHMIQVSGLKFTPIHDFLPRKANPKNQKDTRFIALNNSRWNGASNYGPELKKPYTKPREEVELERISLNPVNIVPQGGGNGLATYPYTVKPILNSQTNLFDTDLSGGGNRVFPNQ